MQILTLVDMWSDWLHLWLRRDRGLVGFVSNWQIPCINHLISLSLSLSLSLYVVSLMDWPPTPDGCSLCLSIYQDAISGGDDARSRQPPLDFISAGSILHCPNQRVESWRRENKQLPLLCLWVCVNIV
jgi:hypothetical protein